MLQPLDADYYLEEDTMRLLDFSDDNEKQDGNSENSTNMKSLPGKAIQIIEEKPFKSNDELPESELYFGGDKEPESERDLRLIKICQDEEMKRLGMTVSSGSVVIKKDNSNMIGISIGGGGPYCPCLYIVQVFDNTPVSKEGTLQSGDEIIGVNGASVKGKTKVEVAKMIQSTGDEVIIHYNKLHADSVQGESLDIALKKIKHRLVENMSAKTADALGLSRAILCNDSLVKRLKELEGTEVMYRGLVDHCKRVLKSYFNVFQTMHGFGTEFCTMSIREPQPTASEAYRSFGEMHRGLEKDGIQMIKQLKPVVANFGTYLNKAIPDTKMTVRKYADSKFAYLSYCLKVKEMDDEEQSFNSIQEPLYRVETGNYEYRLILRCRQEARAKFAKLRNDVLEKIELLEAKHAENLADNLTKLLEGLAKYTQDSIEKFETTKNLFPIEVDLKSDAFTYKSQTTFSHDGTSAEEEEIQPAMEAKESRPSEDLLTNGGKFSNDLLGLMSATSVTTPTINSQSDTENEINSLISGIQNIQSSNQPKSPTSTQELLAELGLEEVNLDSTSTTTSNQKTIQMPFSSIDDLLN